MKTMLMQNVVGETDCNVDRDWRCRIKKRKGPKLMEKITSWRMTHELLVFSQMLIHSLFIPKVDVLMEIKTHWSVNLQI